MRRRWAMLMTGVLAASALGACGGDDESTTWVIGLDAGSDASRAEIRIENGDDIRTFETDLPWNEELVMPNGSYDITLTVRSLDGKEVGCGIDGPHEQGKGASRMNRESQGGGTAVQCRMTGSISSSEYSFSADSEILEEGTGGDATDDTVPETTAPDSTAVPETSVVDTVAAEETTTSAAPEDDATRFLYSGQSLSVQLADVTGGPDMVLRLQIGAGAVLDEPRGLPDYCVISAQLANARVLISLAHLYDGSLEDLLPDAPNGLVRDDRSLDTTPQIVVQQLVGEADANVLYGVAVSGTFKAELKVTVDSAALADGSITMDKVAAALTKILATFVVDPA